MCPNTEKWALNKTHDAIQLKLHCSQIFLWSDRFLDDKGEVNTEEKHNDLDLENLSKARMKKK